MDGVSVMANTAVDLCGGPENRCSGRESDSDDESVVSDYSEMADPVKEHLASIRLLQEAELRFSSVLGSSAYSIHPWLALERRPGEDEIEFLQRQRKVNFLSLAQEFAAIKKVNPDALPFDLHKQWNDTGNKEDGDSDETSLAKELSVVSCVDKTDDDVEADCSERAFDSSVLDSTTNDELISLSSNITDSCLTSIFHTVEAACNSETSAVVPDVVQGLHQSASCDTSKQLYVDYVDGCQLPDAYSQSDIKTVDKLNDSLVSHSQNVDLMRHQQRENIRLKLVVSEYDDAVFGSESAVLPNEVRSCRSSCASLRMCYVNEAAFDDDDDDDIHSDHEQLDTQPQCSPDLIAGMRRAKYASSEEMIQPSTELRLCQETSGRLPETDLMEWKLDRFDCVSLQRFNTAQLQVVVNDQLSRIEALNNELVERLLERDDLHRRQDSLLVDVEDLSRFLSSKLTSTEVPPSVQPEDLQY